MQNSPLNTEISCFANYRTSGEPKKINMMTWLKSDKYAEKVQQIRSIENKVERDDIKATLPAITPSGIFTYRAAEKLVQHSGLLQFDIDQKGNENIGNYKQLKQQICNISNVLYCGLSVSGTGYWGLVQIKYPDKHKAHFDALENSFAKLGITIDSAPANVASLRGYSWDPNAYFNHNAAVFEKLYTKPKRKRKPRKWRDSGGSGDTRSKVEQLISKINTDITGGYHSWLKLGFALENEFGEGGRDYFHAISQYHSEYNRRECDRQYTHCLKHRGSGVSIGTLFHVCRQHGITLKDNLNGSTAKYESKKNENPAPHGYNPYTGVVFDKRGYPSDWDDISLQDATLDEKKEAELIAMQDANPREMCELHFN